METFVLIMVLTAGAFDETKVAVITQEFSSEQLCREAAQAHIKVLAAKQDYRGAARVSSWGCHKK